MIKTYIPKKKFYINYNNKKYKLLLQKYYKLYDFTIQQELLIKQLDKFIKNKLYKIMNNKTYRK